ncbi:MAG: MFS transporter [Thiotrichales bacterium]|nr:MFS transporter [Thiotrichales bacterium]
MVAPHFASSPVVGFSTLLSYGFLAMPLAMLGIPLYLYLPLYYHQNYDMSLTAIGSALLLARLTDVVTDPLIGSWSDRWASQWPRKWQVVSGFALLLLGVYHLFFPLGFESITSKPVTWVWLLFWSFITYLGWTWVQVPYLTLAAELTKDDYQKSRLAGVREGFAIIGVIGVLVLPLALNQAIENQVFFQSLWMTFALLLGVSGFLLLWLSPFKTQTSLQRQHPWQALLRLKRQQPQLLKLFPIYFLNNLANALPASLFVFFVADYLLLEAHKGLFLLVYFMAGLLALPFWLWLSKRWGKAKTWRISISLAGLSFLGVLWLSPGDFNGFLIICILSGLSLAIDLAMPASMQADLSQQQPQTAGLLFGIWGMVTKMALAVAAGISLPLYEWGQTLSLPNGWVLLGLYALLPIVLKLWAMGLLQRFKSF